MVDIKLLEQKSKEKHGCTFIYNSFANSLTNFIKIQNIFTTVIFKEERMENGCKKWLEGLL